MKNPVKRITIVRVHDGAAEVVESLRFGPEKKKRLSSAAKPFEKASRRMLKAQKAFSDTLLQRHDRSNAKRKDGFARDGFANAMKAQRKAWKIINK